MLFKLILKSFPDLSAPSFSFWLSSIMFWLPHILVNPENTQSIMHINRSATVTGDSRL